MFRVYPTIPEGIREIDENNWALVEETFNNGDNVGLLKALLSFDLFPIKDSYIAYLRKDPSSIERNPATVERLIGRLYEMGLTNIYQRCTEPKETNRQIGPFFRRWLQRGSLGVELLNHDDFLNSDGNAILDGSDHELSNFAVEHLNYGGQKGLDLVGRFNNKYVIGEAKFLTDNGGHQNAQFRDAIAVLEDKDVDEEVVKIGILDGILYIKSKTKMHRHLIDHEEHNIMSSLVLREFLYQL